MDYSTSITERMVKEVSFDLCKVILNYCQAGIRQRKKIDTGKFKRIYRGK